MLGEYKEVVPQTNKIFVCLSVIFNRFHAIFIGCNLTLVRSMWRKMIVLTKFSDGK
jgi:hypothetical protein